MSTIYIVLPYVHKYESKSLYMVYFAMRVCMIQDRFWI